jgi:methylthioribose-1-phosphate isomerase
MFTAMTFKSDALHLIDQRQLPHQEVWLQARNLDQVAEAIENMTVRGAPAIATAAAYALVLDAKSADVVSWRAYRERFFQNCQRLHSTRPTAVNLANALQTVKREVESLPEESSLKSVTETLLGFAERLERADLETCQAIGHHGTYAESGASLRVMTHCNTGSLATAGYGTALGVIRSLHKDGRLEHVYVDETRPYLQGSRLTAFELQAEGIPYSIQADSAAAYLMRHEKVDMVVVGADRIAANGDTANKVGTYSLAIVAKFHGVPFYVAAPLSTFDLKTPDGHAIPIEMRSPEEVTRHAGQAVAPHGAAARNPSFDVTPAELISGIITEHGVIRPPYSLAIAELFKK